MGGRMPHLADMAQVAERELAEAESLSQAQSTQQAIIDEVAWNPEGYSFWQWDGRRVGYIEAGEASGQPVLLVHGFGGSAYHWRRNINALASRGLHVFAIDLLGFGQSDKPADIVYDAEDVWVAQCARFMVEVMGCGEREGGARRAMVAGNSLGGFVSLAAAATHKDLVSGCVLLNSAGRFEQVEEAVAVDEKEGSLTPEIEAAQGIVREAVAQLRQNAVEAMTRAVLYASFYLTRSRIAPILAQVYPISPHMVDDNLIASIEGPARERDAAEVFYRVVSRNGVGPPQTVDRYLRKLRVPLLLLWGKFDPWIRPSTADLLQRRAAALGVETVSRVDVNAGHCPMDEAPAEVNAALLDFAAKIA